MFGVDGYTDFTLYTVHNLAEIIIITKIVFVLFENKKYYELNSLPYLILFLIYHGALIITDTRLSFYRHWKKNTLIRIIHCQMIFYFGANEYKMFDAVRFDATTVA